MRLVSGASLWCLGLVMVTPSCGGAAFSQGDGTSDASNETGNSSGSGNSSGGSQGSSASSGGSGSGGGHGGSGSGGSSSGSSGGSASSSGGSGSGSGSGSSSGSGASSGTGSSSSSGGRVDAGADGGSDGSTICDCSVDPQCCAPSQLCCSFGGPVGTAIVGASRCYTPTPTLPHCPIVVSDRNLKRDVEPVDAKAILRGVAGMSVSTWSYKTDDPSVRHLGPMAQDFYSAFGLGDTDRGYYSVDAHGVALAAIKALADELQEQNARIERLERENRELRGRATCGQ